MSEIRSTKYQTLGRQNVVVESGVDLIERQISFAGLGLLLLQRIELYVW